MWRSAWLTSSAFVLLVVAVKFRAATETLRRRRSLQIKYSDAQFGGFGGFGGGGGGVGGHVEYNVPSGYDKGGHGFKKMCIKTCKWKCKKPKCIRKYYSSSHGHGYKKKKKHGYNKLCKQNCEWNCGHTHCEKKNFGPKKKKKKTKKHAVGYHELSEDPLPPAGSELSEDVVHEYMAPQPQPQLHRQAEAHPHEQAEYDYADESEDARGYGTHSRHDVTGGTSNYYD